MKQQNNMYFAELVCIAYLNKYSLYQEDKHEVHKIELTLKTLGNKEIDRPSNFMLKNSLQNFPSKPPNLEKESIKTVSRATTMS